MGTNKTAYIEKAKQTMKVESAGIEALLKDIEKLVPVIEKFDGKVINKRFFDALDATGKPLYNSEWLGVKTLELTANQGVNVGTHWEYPSNYRKAQVNLVLNEKRLDSAGTLENLNKAIARLEKAKIDYTFNETELSKQFDEIERIDNEIKAIFENTNYATREALSRFSSYIR